MKNKKYRLQKDLAYLSMSLCLIVFVWVGSNIYNVYVTSTIDDTLKLQIIPIQGKFDVEAIEKLKSREAIQPDYNGNFASDEAEIVEPSPSPAVSRPQMNFSDSPIPIETPISTNGSLNTDTTP